MRVAIVGAGLAGLACAHELERLGVLPVIYEHRHDVGKPVLIVETMAQFLHYLPGQDIFHHIRQECGLPLNPHAAVRRMILHGPSQQAQIAGLLAYTTLRGPDDRSLERQLLHRVATQIRFGESPDIWALRREFDWVVVATGDFQWSRQVTTVTVDIDWWVRGGVVRGAFNPAEQHFFLNPRYVKTGYAMISPIDEVSAIVGVGVPHSNPEEAEQYWEAFRSGEGHFWNGETDRLPVTRIEIGRVGQVVMGNIMLVGQAGGFCEPLGLAGQCPSLHSGVMAARQIVLGDRSLERLARRFRTHYNRLWRIRRNVNAWTGVEMDRMVASVGLGAGVLARSPVSLLGPASWGLDLLRLADDSSPELGPG